MAAAPVLFGIARMDVAGRLLGLHQESRQGLVGRHRAHPVEAGIGRVAIVESPGQPLPAVVIGLIQRDQVGHLGAPVHDPRLAERLQEIEAAENLRQPFHLLLIGRVDRHCRAVPQRQDQRGALTPRELLDLIAAGIDMPPAPAPLNPFSVRARLAAGPGFDRAALLAFSPTATERRAAAAQLLAGIASTVQSQPFAAVLETQLWSRLAEEDARLMTDRRGNQVAAHCCVQATPADWLRLGLHRSRAMTAGQAPQTIATAGRALAVSADGAVLWIGTGAAPSGLEMLLQAGAPAAAPDE